MTQPTQPTLDIPDSNLRKLIAQKLGRDPIEYALERRASTTPPLAWNRIANELKDKTGEYLTQEAVRRWVRAYNRAKAQQEAETQRQDAA